MDEIEEIEGVAQIIFDAIFLDRPSMEDDGETLLVKKTAKSKVRLVEYDGLTYIKQNPHRSSWWAKEAQEGYQIMWVMRGR